MTVVAVVQRVRPAQVVTVILMVVLAVFSPMCGTPFQFRGSEKQSALVKSSHPRRLLLLLLLPPRKRRRRRRKNQKKRGVVVVRVTAAAVEEGRTHMSVRRPPFAFLLLPALLLSPPPPPPPPHTIISRRSSSRRRRSIQKKKKSIFLIQGVRHPPSVSRSRTVENHRAILLFLLVWWHLRRRLQGRCGNYFLSLLLSPLWVGMGRNRVGPPPRRRQEVKVGRGWRSRRLRKEEEEVVVEKKEYRYW